MSLTSIIDSSLANLIDGVKSLLKTEENDAAQKYRETTIKLTDGKTIKPADLLAVLKAAGKTTEDLHRDVQARRDRRAKVEQFRKLPKIVGDLQEAEASIRAAEAELLAAQQRYDGLIYPLLARTQELRAEQERIRALRNDLVTSADDPKLVAKKAEAVQALATANRRLNVDHAEQRRLRLIDPEYQVSRRHGNLVGALGEVSQSAEYHRDLEQTKTRHAAEVARLDAERVKLEAAVRKAEADVAAVEEETVNWTC